MARTKKSLDNVDISNLLKDLNKEFSTTETLPRVKSDLLSLDIVLGGQGIPLGKTIEIASASGVGKSTLLLHVSKNLCRQGYRVVWLDTEYATDDELLTKMGLMEYKDDLFNIFQVGTFESVEKILDTLIPTGQVQFVVLDSLANLTSEANLASTVYQKDVAKSVENKQVAGDARSQTLFMKKYKAMCAKNNVTMFFVNQLRQFIPTGYGQVAKEVHSGAKAVKYNMDCIIDLISAGKIKGKKTTINGEEEIDIGSNVFFYIKEKSRICQGGVKVPGAIMFGKGFSNISTVKILMELKKVEYNGKMVKMLSQSGQTYTLTFGGQQITATYQTGLREAIRNHYDEIIAEFGAEDFNVVKDDFDQATSVDLQEDPTADENFDRVNDVFNEESGIGNEEGSEMSNEEEE